jgi:3-oxoadipate enol-lactonase
MGGMVGQELALRHPSLVGALVLANTTSAYPPAAREVWEQRIATVQEQGIEPIADAVMGRYFTDRFRAERGAVVARFRERVVSTDATGYIGCCAAVGAVDTTARLGAIAAPTLVIAGELDQGTPVAMAETLAAGIPDARLTVLKDASHLSAIEQPQAFAEAVTGFIATL